MSKLSNSDFLLNFEAEIKRLYQEFSISTSNPIVPEQITEKIRTCINFLIEEKKNLEKLKSNNILNLDSYQIDEILQAKNKLKSSQNDLQRYEKSLIEKAHILEKKESDFKYVIQALNQDKANFDAEKNILAEKIRIHEKNSKELEEKLSKFIQEYNNFVYEKQLLENERERISVQNNQVKNSVNLNEKISKANDIMKEKLDKEMIKYQEMNKTLNELQEELVKKQKYLQNDKEEIDRGFKALEIERNNIKQEKEDLLKLKEQVNQETINLHLRLGELQKSRNYQFSDSSNGSRPINSKDASEIESLFISLQDQLVIFNEEISIKESRLLALQKKNIEDHEKIVKSFSQINQINNSLNESKKEIIIFYSETLPVIEFLYNKVQNLTEDLNENLKKVNVLHNRITQDVYLRSLISDNETTSKGIPEKLFFNTAPESDANLKNSPKTIEGLQSPKNSEEFNIKKFLPQSEGYFLSDSKAVDDMLKELTAKIKSVQEKERQLNFKKKNILKASELIEKAKIQIVIEKDEVNKEREKNKILKYELENAIKDIESKDAELKVYRQELDKTASLLKIKENQIEIRMMQLRSD